MMTRETFLAAFDTDRWLTGPDVLAHLEASGFWDPWWRQASQAAKLVTVQSQVGASGKSRGKGS